MSNSLMIQGTGTPKISDKVDSSSSMEAQVEKPSINKVYLSPEPRLVSSLKSQSTPVSSQCSLLKHDNKPKFTYIDSKFPDNPLPLDPYGALKSPQFPKEYGLHREEAQLKQGMRKRAILKLPLGMEGEELEMESWASVSKSQQDRRIRQATFVGRIYSIAKGTPYISSSRSLLTQVASQTKLQTRCMRLQSDQPPAALTSSSQSIPVVRKREKTYTSVFKPATSLCYSSLTPQLLSDSIYNFHLNVKN